MKPQASEGSNSGLCRLGLCAVLLFLPALGCRSAAPTAPAAPRSYVFWPQAPAAPRVQFLRSFALTTDINLEQQSGFEKLVFGAGADESVAINKPYGVAMHAGRIYVCDIRSKGVTVLDLARKPPQARLMGVTGLNRLQQPTDVAIAPDGMIYVADKGRGIVVFDQSERHMHVFGDKDFQPISLAVHNDRLYVCNMAEQNIAILDRHNGRRLGAIGTVGDDDGQFRLPLGIDADSQGNIHVVDIMRCRLQKFSPSGKLLLATGQMTDTAGNFVRPKHVAVDADGMVYVVDAAFQNVQVFDAEYKLLTSFGSAGTHPGSMDLPAGICVATGTAALFDDLVHPGFDACRLVVATNQFGPNKIAVYAVGHLKPGITVAELAASQHTIGRDTRETGTASPLGDLVNQSLEEEQ